MASTKIVLNSSEDLVRTCLLDCRNEMKDEVPGMANLELRFAGGWVRDKLLGKQSHDIDVALSTMTGEKFGEALLKFMQTNEEKYLQRAKDQGIPAIIKGLHKIEKNPELSKHLETVTTKMFGLDMDFVNLRKEVYDDVSRNPVMEFGTPEEDALRRDATVNALFYNLDSGQVEDYTHRGLDDMREGIMRTPLEPYQTFKDDPLRVLRLIRFASRLGYRIEPVVFEAMEDKRIHAALKAKISRERVGTEVFKIMEGPDPLCGLTYIVDRGMYGVVFAAPQSITHPSAESIIKTYEELQHILHEQSPIGTFLHAADDMVSSWFLATYVPWSNPNSGAVGAAKDGIRAPNTMTKLLGDAIKCRSAIVKAVDNVFNNAATLSSVGMTLRASGAAWRGHVLYSYLCDITTQNDEQVRRKYAEFCLFVGRNNLENADSMKPLLNGNEVKRAMQITKAGPWLKKAIDAVVEWQFDHPDGTVEQAQAMLLSRKEELQDP